MRFLEYKGYTGSIEYSREDNLLFGKVLGISDLVSYEGHTGNELEKDFIRSIDQYTEECAAKGKRPEKPFKGSFNVRIPTEIHKAATLEALNSNITLNRFVAEAIRAKLYKSTEVPKQV
jgi:predicted HicB family RNase H-like nuclease